jgi:hypothetical protein
VQAAAAVMTTAAALFDELTALKFALEEHNVRLAVSGCAATSARLQALHAEAALIEQSRSLHTAQLAQARGLQAAIEESAKLVEEYKRHKKELVKTRTARTTAAAAVKAAEETLALETEGSDEHQELTESLAKSRADFKRAEAALRATEEAERKAGLTVRLRELTTLLPELLLQFPELDLLFGTAAAGLQVSRSVARDYKDHQELQTEPTRVVRATLAATGEQCVLKRVTPALLSNTVRFRQTCHVMARLHHPNVVGLQSVVRDDSDGKPAVWLETSFRAQGDLQRFIEFKAVRLLQHD